MMYEYNHYVNEKERKEDEIEHKVQSIEEAFKKEIDEMKRTKKRMMSMAERIGVEIHIEDMLRDELEL